MDFSVYVLEKLVAMRLEEARAQSAHASLVASLRPHRLDALAILSLGVIKLGRFFQRRGGVRHRTARTFVVRMLGSRHV